MKRLIPLLLLACTLALVVPAAPSFLPPGRAAAQAPNARPQWEYASLVIGDAAADVQWQAGGTTLTGPGDVTRPDLDRSVKELYRQLGGLRAFQDEIHIRPGAAQLVGHVDAEAHQSSAAHEMPIAVNRWQAVVGRELRNQVAGSQGQSMRGNGNGAVGACFRESRDLSFNLHDSCHGDRGEVEPQRW